MSFILFMSVFFAVGSGVTGWGLYCILKSHQAASWPTVYGALIDCKMKESWDDGVSWRVEANYSYVVSGQIYQGSRISFGYSGTSARGPHLSIYEKIRKAKDLVVRYNPKKPEEAVLAYGATKDNLITLGLGLSFLILSAGVTILNYLSEVPEKPIDVLTIVFMSTALLFLAMLVSLSVLIRQTDTALLRRVEIRP